ncbi:MAG TPA: cytochrome C oxidase subunit IV family protein [Opitutaceae bacterium]|nr:cytochrome C oxidase subunit IV family protein [Opitutaceae bacterium]
MKHAITTRNLISVFIGLLMLLGLTVGANYLDLGRYSVTVALLIALIKAVLIIWFFMQVRTSPGIVRLYAAAGFLWLTIMLLLTFSDYAAR